MIIHNIFNNRDTECAICIQLVILKISDGKDPHLNIDFVWCMSFNANFNNSSVISWLLALLMEETGVPR